ncbi:hypothetical protein AALT_g10323 [Alternaria alternata]|nr:hypothetical protein AALT_g10323 [Alternaria alternata]
MGFFHEEDTGMKDIGGGLILTHVSLVIALIVQLCKGTSTSVDAAIGATILDAQNVALHVPLSAKQTLAARWQVILLMPTQILGLVFLPVLVFKLNRGDFAADDCKCLYVFWWSRLGDCGESPKKELSVFWVYYSVRWVIWFQSSLHAMYNTDWFHRAEKVARTPISTGAITTLQSVLELELSETQQTMLQARISTLEQRHTDRTVERATIQAGFLYQDYPATISMFYMTYAMYSLTSMVVAEVTIHEFNLQPSSDDYSIGQIIAIVVSGATILQTCQQSSQASWVPQLGLIVECLYFSLA